MNLLDSDADPTSQRAEPLPLRACVGMVVVNAQGLVWAGARRPKWAPKSEIIWQLPQGGLRPGEPPESAAIRELYEETNIRSAHIIGSISDWMTYELPPELVGVALKGRYRGQRFKWFLMQFDGVDGEIDIGPRSGKKAEFDAWKWLTYGQFLELCQPHRRGLYEVVGRALLPGM